MTDHEMFAQWSAAYVLGALDSADRAAFERHLGTCERCQEEVRQFAPIPGLLARIDSIESTPVPESVLEAAVQRARSEQRQLLSSRNNWRLAALVSAMAAVVLFLVALPGWLEPERTVVSLDSNLSVTGEVGLEAKAWGTALTLEVEDLPDSDVYVAWAVDHEGAWQQVAAWGPIPGPRAQIEGASSWRVTDLSTIVITTGDKDEILASGTTPDT